MLSHLFRKHGKTLQISEAVYCLSFQWRYGSPSYIRKILTLASESNLISIEDGVIRAEFLYDSQRLHPNQADALGKISFSRDVSPLY
ncbi:MAG: DUF2240 family protein [Candidatus Thorarchaeota archaeon]